jgi:hypothetical protein
MIEEQSMGMSADIIWDYLLQKQVNDLRTKGAETAHAAEEAVAKSRSLEQQHAELRLVTLALWSLVKGRLSLTDEQLREELTKLQQTVSAKVIECPSCKRRTPSSSNKCMYCGAATFGLAK